MNALPVSAPHVCVRRPHGLALAGRLLSRRLLSMLSRWSAAALSDACFDETPIQHGTAAPLLDTYRRDIIRQVEDRT
jgi:hypothetical protein